MGSNRKSEGKSLGLERDGSGFIKMRIVEIVHRADMRCQVLGLTALVRNWSKKMEEDPGRIVVFVNFDKTMVSVINGASTMWRKRLPSKLDLAVLRSILENEFGLTSESGGTYEEKFAKYFDRARRTKKVQRLVW